MTMDATNHWVPLPGLAEVLHLAGVRAAERKI